MLKIRLMGTKNKIVWFQKILQRHPKVEVMEFSEPYQNKGTSKYYRVYTEVQKSKVKIFENSISMSVRATEISVESISQYGVLVPVIVRPRIGGGYELISRYRKKRGLKLAEKTDVRSAWCSWQN